MSGDPRVGHTRGGAGAGFLLGEVHVDHEADAAAVPMARSAEPGFVSGGTRRMPDTETTGAGAEVVLLDKVLKSPRSGGCSR